MQTCHFDNLAFNHNQACEIKWKELTELCNRGGSKPHLRASE